MSLFLLLFFTLHLLANIILLLKWFPFLNRLNLWIFNSIFINPLLTICIAIVQTRNLFNYFRNSRHNLFVISFFMVRRRRRWSQSFSLTWRRWRNHFYLSFLLFLINQWTNNFRRQLWFLNGYLLRYIFIFYLFRGRWFTLDWYWLCWQVFDNMSHYLLILYYLFLSVLGVIYYWLILRKNVIFNLIIAMRWLQFLFESGSNLLFKTFIVLLISVDGICFLWFWSIWTSHPSDVLFLIE